MARERILQIIFHDALEMLLRGLPSDVTIFPKTYGTLGPCID
jgi:hypothetical protein